MSKPQRKKNFETTVISADLGTVDVMALFAEKGITLEDLQARAHAPSNNGNIPVQPVKTFAIETENRSIAECLPPEGNDEIVFITRSGKVRFVLVPLIDMEEHAEAVQKDGRLLSYIAKWFDRARRGLLQALPATIADLAHRDKQNGSMD